MNVELILRPLDGGVDDESDRVALRNPSARAPEERSRAPCGVEIIRRVRRLQPWVFDADDLARRGQEPDPDPAGRA